MREHRFYKTDDKQPPAGRKSALKKGQSKPGVKFSKVNRVQSEDGGEEDDYSCIDSEVSSDSSMSVDRPPKSLVWKDRPKSRKVSKIRTVSTIHRTTRLEPPTEDTTNDAAPQPNVSDSRGANDLSRDCATPCTSEEESENGMASRVRTARFRNYRGTKWYDFETEEQDKHDDPPLPATTSNTRRSIPVPKYEDRHSEPEPTSDSKLPGPIKDDKSPGEDSEQPGTGKMSPESEYHFDFRPDTSSEGSNPADREAIPNEINAYYPKYFIDEFEDTEDYLSVYARYRIAGGRKKLKEFHTGNELCYTQFPGIELSEVGVWTEDPTMRADNV